MNDHRLEGICMRKTNETADKFVPRTFLLLLLSMIRKWQCEDFITFV